MAGIEAFAELTLEVTNLAAASRFYEQVVGLPVLIRDEDRIWLGVGERGRLGLWLPGEKEFGDEGGAHVHFAFSVEPGGLEVLQRRLEGEGVDVRGPVEHDGGDRSLYFEDPEGNVVEAWDFFERGGDVSDLSGCG